MTQPFRAANHFLPRFSVKWGYTTHGILEYRFCNVCQRSPQQTLQIKPRNSCFLPPSGAGPPGGNTGPISAQQLDESLPQPAFTLSLYFPGDGEKKKIAPAMGSEGPGGGSSPLGTTVFPQCKMGPRIRGLF